MSLIERLVGLLWSPVLLISAGLNHGWPGVKEQAWIIWRILLTGRNPTP